MAGHRHAGKVDLRVLGCSQRNFRAVAGLRRHGRVGGWEAGRGNRTLVFSLEGYCSTIELHPRRTTAGSSKREPRHPGFACWAGVFCQGILGSGECRIRTCEGIIHQIYSLTPLTARETPLVLLPVGQGQRRMLWLCAGCMPLVGAAGGCRWQCLCGGRDLWLGKWLRWWFSGWRNLRNRGSLVRAEIGPALAAGRAC